jgi:hypothetical protein
MESLRGQLSDCINIISEEVSDPSIWIQAQRVGDGTIVPENTEVSLTFSKIQNPPDAGITKPFKIETKNKDGTPIESMMVSGHVLNIIERADVVLSSYDIGATTELTLTMVSAMDFGSNGKLSFRFPDIFTDISGANLAAPPYFHGHSGDVEGSFTLSIDHDTNSIVAGRHDIETNHTVKAGREIVFVFGGIVNPYVDGKTPDYQVNFLSESNEVSGKQTPDGSVLLLVPTATPTLAPTAPTAVPTLNPTLEAVGPCINNDNCDTEVSVCQHDPAHEPSTWCQCIDGYVMGVSGKCEATYAPSVSPTEASPIPTTSPTLMPTLEVCLDGTHGCDPLTTVCVELSGAPSCECLLGFSPNPDDLMSCLTAAPTSFPTKEEVATTIPTALPTPSAVLGTKSPTLAPTHIPTAQPTFASCADGLHGCEEESTFCIATVVAGNVIIRCHTYTIHHILYAICHICHTPYTIHTIHTILTGYCLYQLQVP